MTLKRFRNCISYGYKLYIILFLFLNVFLPIVERKSIPDINSREIFERILQRYQITFYSASIIVLFIFIFLPYISEEGREVLYLINRMHLFETMIITCFFSINLLFTCCWWHHKLFSTASFYLKNFIIIVCFCSFCYFLFYVFKNITIAVIILLSFFLITIINPAGLFQVEPCTAQQSITDILLSMWEYLLMIVVCLPIGTIANKKYKYYS